MEMHDRFDKEWEDAFDHAEMDVSPGLWDSIESEMDKPAAGKYKKRLLFFQLLAAASVLFAMSVGGVAIYKLELFNVGNEASEIALESTDKANGNTSDDRQSQFDTDGHNEALNRSNSNDHMALNTDVESNEGAEVSTSSEERVIPNSKDDANGNSHDHKAASTAGISGQSSLSNNGDIALNANTGDKDGSGVISTSPESIGSVDSGATEPYIAKNSSDILSEDIKSASSGSGIASNMDGREGQVGSSTASNAITESQGHLADHGIHNNSQDPESVDRLFELLEVDMSGDTEMKMVPWYSYVPAKKKHNSADAWAGVGFSAGTYDPNASALNSNSSTQATNDFVANVKRSPSFGEERSGQAYNVGVSFGKRVAERWVLQGGLGYVQQQTNSTSNVISATGRGKSRALSNSKDAESADVVAFTIPYDINNTYELISIPLQAGYVVLDKQFNITLLTGIANNVLIKNQVSASVNGVDDVDFDTGEDARYRTYQINGILGSELSYNFGDKYRLAVIPQFRQALSSVTKSDADYVSKPRMLEIGFRFNYVFN